MKTCNFEALEVTAMKHYYISGWEFAVKPKENNSKSLILGIMDDVDILT